MHTNDPTEVQRVEDTVVVDVFKVVGRPDLPTHTALVFDRKHERSACHDTSETQRRLSRKQNKKNAAKTVCYVAFTLYAAQNIASLPCTVVLQMASYFSPIKHCWHP